MNEENQTQTKKPTHIRVGSVGVSVWKGDERKPTAVTLQRSYRDKEGVWRNTNFLPIGDIPSAIAALQKAYEDFRTER